ncbi:uncharacterized protein LOC112465179 [Temnothorax curvispinosus]|uniref:Uncharacterized protein LOC112465179 n=1 Tax=Temnothorax curvispinosus TaxID=300111 RepID=A0A6J1R697_9HYME|nr:uncharacterized protein LOC112465179 [Temnothorax curvispinosus]
MKVDDTVLLDEYKQGQAALISHDATDVKEDTRRNATLQKYVQPRSKTQDKAIRQVVTRLFYNYRNIYLSPSLFACGNERIQRIQNVFNPAGFAVRHIRSEFFTRHCTIDKIPGLKQCDLKCAKERLQFRYGNEMFFTASSSRARKF